MKIFRATGCISLIVLTLLFARPSRADEVSLPDCDSFCGGGTITISTLGGNRPCPNDVKNIHAVIRGKQDAKIELITELFGKISRENYSTAKKMPVIKFCKLAKKMQTCSQPDKESICGPLAKFRSSCRGSEFYESDCIEILQRWYTNPDLVFSFGPVDDYISNTNQKPGSSSLSQSGLATELPRPEAYTAPGADTRRGRGIHQPPVPDADSNQRGTSGTGFFPGGILNDIRPDNKGAMRLESSGLLEPPPIPPISESTNTAHVEAAVTAPAGADYKQGRGDIWTQLYSVLAASAIAAVSFAVGFLFGNWQFVSLRTTSQYTAPQEPSTAVRPEIYSAVKSAHTSLAEFMRGISPNHAMSKNIHVGGRPIHNTSTSPEDVLNMAEDIHSALMKVLPQNWSKLKEKLTKAQQERDRKIRELDDLRSAYQGEAILERQYRQGLPAFLWESKGGEPYRAFLDSAHKSDPLAAADLEVALRVFHLNCQRASPQKLYESVSGVGRTLFAALDASGADEVRRREQSHVWAQAICKAVDNRCDILVPNLGTPVRSDQMTGGRPGSPVRRIKNWAVLDPNTGRFERRAEVES